MATIERKPLTAYQRRMRKELGGDEDDQPTVDQQMARLEVDIRRLKVEFDIFFNGGVKHPPYETRNRVETTFARLGDDRTLTYAQRYKYNSLASRFASFRDMWRRSMQSKEEGRDFITVARAKLTAMREAADAEIAARNAAKYGTNETTANEAPPAATLIEKPAPELAAPALVDAPARAFKKGPVITATVVPVASSALPPPQLELVAPVKTESKSESARVPATVEPETLAANESLDTNGEGRPIAGAEPDGNKSDATMASVFVDLSNEYQTDGFVIDPVPVDIENITHEFEPGATNIDPAHADQLVAAFEPDVEVISPSAHEQLPVDDGDKRLKQMPTRFPKILPPSDLGTEPQTPPAKYARRTDDRRSGDRRALPFGRRATDYTPEDLKPTTDTPIIVPADRAPESPQVVEAEQVVKTREQPTTQTKVAESSGEKTPTPQSLDRIKSSSETKAPNAEMGSFEFTNPRREPEQVKALVAALIQAKETCGESSADLLPTRYGHLLAARAEKLKKKSGCTSVIFTIVIEGGQVSLNARAGE